MYRALAAFILLVLVVSTSYAQSISEKLYRASVEQKRLDWPTKRAGRARSGTQVRLTFEPEKANITLVTDTAYGQARLVETSRAMATALGYSQAGFTPQLGKDSSTVDIALNNYLAHPQKNVTTISLELAELAEVLKRTDLPKPIVIAIYPKLSKLNRATLDTTEVVDTRFFGLEQIKPGSRLHWSAEVYASGWVVIVTLPALLLGLLVMPWLAQRKAVSAGETTEPEVVKLDDNTLLIAFFLPAIALVLAGTGVSTHAIESACYLASIEGPTLNYLAVSPLLAVASCIGAQFYKKQRSQQ